jgi:predicted nucleic acid-binding protein
LLNERANEDGAERPSFPVEPSAEGWRRSGRTWYDPVMTLRVYVETTVPSYLTAWPSRDLVRAAHQQVTREWWASRGGFELYSSRLVVQECEAGDARAAADRLATLAGIPLLEQTSEAAALAEALMSGVPLPVRAASDAIHIAIAAVHGIDLLVTWNCTHIANATLRPRIEAVCRAAGYEPPLICTPEELPTGSPDDE